MRSGSSSAGANSRRLVEAADEHVGVDRRLEADLAVLTREDLGALIGVGVEALERREHERARSVARACGPAGHASSAARTASSASVAAAAAACPITRPRVRGVVDRERLDRRPLLAPDQELGGERRVAERHVASSLWRGRFGRER